MEMTMVGTGKTMSIGPNGVTYAETSTSPDRGPVIWKQIDQLEKEVEGLNMALGELHGRLESVLGPARAQAQPDSTPPEPEQSTIAKRLAHIRLTVHHITDAVAETLGRLEL